MNFEQPLLLLAFVPIGLLWIIHSYRNRSAEEKRRFPLFIGSIVCLILALANPYWSTVPAQRVLKGVDVVVLLDVSQSMFCPSGNQGIRRIDQARNFLRTLLPQFAGSQLSMIYFAGDAQVGCPFTSDLRAIYLFLDSVTPAMTTIPGTRSTTIPKALVEVLGPEREPSLSRKPLVLLFSDGEFFEDTRPFKGWIEDHKDLRLFSFVCGTGKSPVPKYDLSGVEQKAISETRPDTMQSLAVAGRGFSFNLFQSNPEVITRQVTRKVNEIVAEGEAVPKYQPGPFLLLGFLLLIAYQAFPLLSPVSSISRKAVVLPVIVLLAVSLSFKKEDRQKIYDEALKDVKQKRYEIALKKLRQLEAQNPDEQIEIAIGNIFLYQNKLKEATTQYKRILEGNPQNVTARWNWEVAIKKQTQSNQPPPNPQPKNMPQELPDQTQALLKYFDQLEKEQMQQQNKENASTSSFAW
jgi:hypothetical protein